MVKQAVQAKYCKPAVISFLLRSKQKKQHSFITNKLIVKVIQGSVRKGEKVLRRPPQLNSDYNRNTIIELAISEE